MAKITKSVDRVGKFTRSANSAPPPVKASITRPGDFADGVAKAVAQGRGPRNLLHELSDASQRHPVKREGEREREEGGAYTVNPARSVDELQHQVRLLIDAFVRSEGRKPTARDNAFWTAYAEVLEAYEQEEQLGSRDRITETLTDADAKPDRRRKPPVSEPKTVGDITVRKRRKKLPTGGAYHVIEAK
jgi:hypothetical protein